MSPWQTILVALVSSAVGGFLGSWWTTFMRIRHEREESLRTRMIQAADDFSFGATEGILALRFAVDLTPAEDLDIDQEDLDDLEVVAEDILKIRDAARAVMPHVDLATARLSRISLLFGASSPAGDAASELVGRLRHGVVLLTDDTIPEITVAQRESLQAQEAHSRFIAQARIALEKPRFSESQDWLDAHT